MIARREPNREHIAETVAQSLMLVTALNPRIGYDTAVKTAKTAPAETVTPQDAAAKLRLVRPDDFDRRVVPAAMIAPGAILEGGGG